MTKISKFLIAGAICLAIPACDSNSDAAPAQSDASDAQTEIQSDGRALALDLSDSKESHCALSVDTCLTETYLCLQEEGDDAECISGYTACRDEIMNSSCTSEGSIDIGVNSALRCWNEFDGCAASDADGEMCANALNACISKGSLCDIDAESECDAELCDSERCNESHWDISAYPGANRIPAGHGPKFQPRPGMGGHRPRPRPGLGRSDSRSRSGPKTRPRGGPRTRRDSSRSRSRNFPRGGSRTRPDRSRPRSRNFPRGGPWPRG